MQKTDMELQEAVLGAMDDAAHSWMMQYDNEALTAFLESLSAAGYKIVKDTD